jgi:hypothetical protein
MNSIIFVIVVIGRLAKENDMHRVHWMDSLGNVAKRAVSVL